MTTNPNLNLTKFQAQTLARQDRSYTARQTRTGSWCVWCRPSDHHVEFNQSTLDATPRHQPATITKRFNSDRSVSLIAHGLVVFRSHDWDQLNAFLKGWFGNCPQRFNRSQFHPKRREAIKAAFAADATK